MTDSFDERVEEGKGGKTGRAREGEAERFETTQGVGNAWNWKVALW